MRSEGIILVVSVVRLSTRFIGDFGDARVRDEDRDVTGLTRDDDRRASLTLGGKGTARGDGV